MSAFACIDIFAELEHVEKHFHTVKDYFGNTIPHIHKRHHYPGFDCGISKLNKSQTYFSLARISVYLRRNCSYCLDSCNCAKCRRCHKSKSYTEEYLQHILEFHIFCHIDILNCLYKYVEKVIDQASVLRHCIPCHIDTAPHDKIFQFLDICNTKNINFIPHLVICCVATFSRRRNFLEEIVQRYGAKIYSNINIFIDIVHEFELHQTISRNLNYLYIVDPGHELMHAIKIICKYSDGKYKYVNKNNLCETLEDICKEVNLSVSGIVIREINADIRFAIIMNIKI